MNKRDSIKQRISALNQELKKLEEQEKQKVGEFMLELYQKKDFNVDKIKSGIAKILGDDVGGNSKENSSNSSEEASGSSSSKADSSREESSSARFESNRN